MASSHTIKAIDSGTVHRIQSGQVIVDLCSVAKELVENSFDAGATSIEVRFKNQGMDSIEVQDNGSGISPQSYESLALKHYTSKLSTYDDLTTLQTFGFRGEALSSLCAVSNFTVVTCTKEQAPKASKLEFEPSGKLRGSSIVSGQKGTMVYVENLFHNLPVRRRELERNIKREWGKVISLLNQYACVQTHVKFSVSQQPTKGKKQILFSTRGNPTTRENIINVFGVKTMNALISMDLKLELEATSGPSQRWSTQEDGGTKEIYVRGHISRPLHGEGRQTPDRQMFYVNGRPCGLPQFSKVFNEVYRSYNYSQSPFVFADIQLDTHLYDVNVSPDKRTILLHDQGRMLDNLRESLIELFETQEVTIPIAQASATKQTPFKKLAITRSDTPTSGQRKDIEETRGDLALSTPSRRKLTRAREEDAMEDVQDSGKGEEEEEEEVGQDKRVSRESGKIAGKRSARGVSSMSLARDTQSMNLITRWVERKSTVQEAADSKDPDPENHVLKAGPLSIKEHPLSPKLQVKEKASGSKDPPTDLGESSLAQMGEAEPQEDETGDDRKDEDLSEAVDIAESPSETESPVPAILPPSQLPRPTLNSPIRPGKRSSPEIATITIGDQMVTSIIGSPAKRAKVAGAQPTASTAKPESSRKSTKPLPSFGNRLSQMFSASAPSQEPMAYNRLEIPGDGGDAPSDKVEFLSVLQDDSADQDLDDPMEISTKESESGSSVAEGTNSSRDQEVISDMQQKDDDMAEEQDTEKRDGSAEDSDYMDDDKKKAQEDHKVQEMIRAAEEKASAPTEETEKRSQMLLKGGRKKAATVNLLQKMQIKERTILDQVSIWQSQVSSSASSTAEESAVGGIESRDAEEKLALKISKSDFSRMRIIGQFNLGFILAVREADHSTSDAEAEADDDELFIIDQHASDEKFNFERLQASTIVQSQRLVQPKTLELTAVEEEIILENLAALERNGFVVRFDETGEQPVGSRCQLLSLPLSRETTFAVSDLEELIFLLGDNATSSATTVPRPSKVRKMFAMRACRSSIMIGKALSHKQMRKVVRHMGEMEKPWNCPHGRPTMRHLCGLGGAWEERLWLEGDDLEERPARPNWARWIRERREESAE